MNGEIDAARPTRRDGRGETDVATHWRDGGETDAARPMRRDGRGETGGAARPMQQDQGGQMGASTPRPTRGDRRRGETDAGSGKRPDFAHALVDALADALVHDLADALVDSLDSTTGQETINHGEDAGSEREERGNT